VATLFVAVSVALCIASDATLGTYLGRPIANQFRRIRHWRAKADHLARRAVTDL
jgi:hypothetical protein